MESGSGALPLRMHSHAVSLLFSIHMALAV
jgi:hypothetical protein